MFIDWYSILHQPDWPFPPKSLSTAKSKHPQPMAPYPDRYAARATSSRSSVHRRRQWPLNHYLPILPVHYSMN